jgi:DNA polymerase III epsilon subunit family exonuclease
MNSPLSQQTELVASFVVVDLETTGLSPETDKIIEVSAVLFDAHGEKEGVFTTLINPGIAIPSNATRVNGITNRMVATAPRFADVAKDLQAHLLGRVLVGHNVTKFDIRFLKKAFNNVGIDYDPPAVLDTLSLSKIALPGLTSHKLEKLCELAGINNNNAHRAESDALATWHLLCALAIADIDDVTDLDKYNLPFVNQTIPPSLITSKPRPVEPDMTLRQTCVGEVVVFTGINPEGYKSRDEAANDVLRRGGRVGNTVTKKTTALFAGDNAGAKYDRARQLSKPVYPLTAFADFLAGGHEAALKAGATSIQRFDGSEEVLVAGIDSIIPSTQTGRDINNDDNTLLSNPTEADSNPVEKSILINTELVTGNYSEEGLHIEDERLKGEKLITPFSSSKRTDLSKPQQNDLARSSQREERKIVTLATISLILGIFGFLGFGSIGAIVISHICLKMLRSSSTKRGRRRAIAGMILGYIGVSIIGLVLFQMMFYDV